MRRSCASGFAPTAWGPSVGGQDAIAMPAGKADLKKILRFLDEDYYQSTLQSRNFVTNSKRPA